MKDGGSVLMNNEWVQIEEFPNYEVNRCGLIKNKTTGYIKHISMSKIGYPVVSLRKNGKMYLRTIHIILGRTFMPNPENKEQINHIDGDKKNYNLTNLEWCTPRENLIHARKTGLHTSDGDKAVAQISTNGTVVNVYKSASEASRQTGIGRSHISNVARGNTREKTAGGFKWKYV